MAKTFKIYTEEEERELRKRVESDCMRTMMFPIGMGTALLMDVIAAISCPA